MNTHWGTQHVNPLHFPQLDGRTYKDDFLKTFAFEVGIVLACGPRLYVVLIWSESSTLELPPLYSAWKGSKVVC
jgi:hypothetical protein